MLDRVGRPIRVPEDGTVVGDKGEVLLDGVERARLGIYGSMASRDYQKIGNNLYRYSGGGQPNEATDPKVR